MHFRRRSLVIERESPAKKHGRRDRVAPIRHTALMTDRGEAGMSLLVEPEATVKCESQRQKLLDSIWPSMQSANEICPAEQRIQRGLVAVTRPMPWAVKGYPRRKMVYDELYDKGLDGLDGEKEVRMKALEIANLAEEAKVDVEANAQSIEEWHEKYGLKGGTTVRLALPVRMFLYDRRMGTGDQQ